MLCVADRPLCLCRALGAPSASSYTDSTEAVLLKHATESPRNRHGNSASSPGGSTDVDLPSPALVEVALLKNRLQFPPHVTLIY